MKAVPEITAGFAAPRDRPAYITCAMKGI